jgi:hypothetical protein
VEGNGPIGMLMTLNCGVHKPRIVDSGLSESYIVCILYRRSLKCSVSEVLNLVVDPATAPIIEQCQPSPCR